MTHLLWKGKPIEVPENMTRDETCDFCMRLHNTTECLKETDENFDCLHELVELELRKIKNDHF